MSSEKVAHPKFCRDSTKLWLAQFKVRQKTWYAHTISTEVVYIKTVPEGTIALS